MKKFNYLEILFTGLEENANDIKEFIIRHQKLAKRDNFITSESFYLNMSAKISDLKSKIENIFYNRQNDLNMALDFRKANNGNTKVIEDQLNSMKLNDFGLNILTLSKGTFKGHLRYSELQYLGEIIKETSIKIVDEKQKIETNKPDEVKSIYSLNENNFDNVEPQKVVNHFYKLVENGYITQSNFNLFIEIVFYKNQTLNSKIDIIKPNSKGRVKKIFYKYYDSIQSEKYSNQEKYLKLLTDNFSGFNYNSLKTNFSK